MKWYSNKIMYHISSSLNPHFPIICLCSFIHSVLEYFSYVWDTLLTTALTDPCLLYSNITNTLSAVHTWEDWVNYCCILRCYTCFAFNGIWVWVYAYVVIPDFSYLIILLFYNILQHSTSFLYLYWYMFHIFTILFCNMLFIEWSNC